jgi:hypothetical protein
MKKTIAPESVLTSLFDKCNIGKVDSNRSTEIGVLRIIAAQ